MANPAKRAYSPPFSPSESSFLVEVLRKYAHILEGKETDAHSTLDKNQAWESLSAEFNARGLVTFRNTTSLKNKWKLLKKDARKEFASSKKYSNGTGGGPPGKEPSDLYHSIIGVTGDVSIEGGKGSPDSDCRLINGPTARPTINPIAEISQESSDIEDQLLEEVFEDVWDPNMENDTTNVENSSSAANTNVVWNGSGYTPAMLKQPPNKALRCSQPTGIGKKGRNFDTYRENVEKKKDILNLQEQHFKEVKGAQEAEKESLKTRTAQDKELHTLRLENEKEQHMLFTEEFTTRTKRETAVFQADIQSRFVKQRRDGELFELEKKKLNLEIQLLNKKLGVNSEELNNNKKD
uniref:Regulatory protein zeste n=1 Tax=Cacopsylla melanoneura TaxID=428564 RepID=A0A8D8VS76_9HEMI